MSHASRQDTVPSIHILGICGTFMGGIAALARESGYAVSGCDQNVYPPMSTQLQALGIRLQEGYGAEQLGEGRGMFVIGNALTRGKPLVEAILDAHARYQSGPQWLAENVLQGRTVCAVAGTHGKTTTSSLLAWLLESAGMQPGFLIGGVPQNFDVSARLGSGKCFVIEADEYDTAFFDKRSKFVHYQPSIAVLNNLEFDHADIFERLEDIERQFHHLVRIVPRSGALIVNGKDPVLARVLARGCWTPVQTFALLEADEDASAWSWSARLISQDGSAFAVFRNGSLLGELRWAMTGRHSVANALAALAAAVAAGAAPERVLAAIPRFAPPKRRMELIFSRNDLQVFDDFAHHPSAIATTLDGLRASVGPQRRLVVALEPRSNTMRLGTMAEQLPDALKHADEVHLLAKPDLRWDAGTALSGLGMRLRVHQSVDALQGALVQAAASDCVMVLMSNGSFDGLRESLLQRLTAHAGSSTC